MALARKLPRHLRDALGPEAGEELVLILEEMRREMLAHSAQMNERFDRMDRRLDRIDQRLDRVDQRLDRVDQRLDRVDQRLDGVDQRLDGMDQRLDKVDDRFTALERRVSDVKSDLMKRSFVFWCGSVTAIALLARVLER